MTGTGTSAAMTSVLIPAGVMLRGDLTIPPDASAIVVFAHGSGSSRSSPRNQRVARRLQDAGFATLLFDLLTADEESLDAMTGEFRFDVAMLAERLDRTAAWLRSRQATSGLAIGYFGASTGAAAALIAAAARPAIVRAVVSRGGRPDLAGAFLPSVAAPTLLIVGGADRGVIELNESAFRRLGAREKQLEIVPGATHLFEEPGALDRVADLASSWFIRYLAPAVSDATR